MYLINIQGKENIYMQIKKQIIRFIDIGVLKPDDKLPSVRNLASDLGINPNTVARAYADLEKDGIIYTLNKKGVFVLGKQKNNYRIDSAKLAIENLKNDGLSKKELLEVINIIYKEGKDA